MILRANAIHDRFQKLSELIISIVREDEPSPAILGDGFLCIKCSKIIIGRAAFLMHKCPKDDNSSCTENVDDVNGNYELDNRASSIESESLKTISNQFICDFCKRTYNYKQSLQDHIMSKHIFDIRINSRRKKFCCNKCSKTYQRASSLKEHIQAVHEQSNVPYLECNYCSKKYAYKFTLLCHIQKNHLNNKEFGKLENLMFKCTTCGSKYKSKLNYDEHVKTHDSDETTMMCIECKKIFKNKKVLKRHIKLIHTDAKEVKCPECDKQFKSERYLKSHLKLHTGQGNLICPICGKRYKNPSDLNMHLLIHSNHKKYICQLCDKSFSQPAGLAVHQREVHDKGVKDYPCRKCEKILKSYIERYNHEWLHDNPNGKGCDICGHICKSRAYFHHHKRSVHGTGHICTVCGYQTTTIQFLKQHMVKHTGDKPYKCNCGQVFAWKRTMDDHIKKHHC